MLERGMKRCRAEGAEYFALFVGAAVLANNLMIVAALLTRRSLRRSKVANRNPTWRQRINTENRAYRARKCKLWLA